MDRREVTTTTDLAQRCCEKEQLDIRTETDRPRYQEREKGPVMSGVSRCVLASMILYEVLRERGIET